MPGTVAARNVLHSNCVLLKPHFAPCIVCVCYLSDLGPWCEQTRPTIDIVTVRVLIYLICVLSGKVLRLALSHAALWCIELLRCVDSHVAPNLWCIKFVLRRDHGCVSHWCVYRLGALDL